MSNWCFPVLDLPEYVIWDGCGFLDEGYYKATISPATGRGSVHPGDDYNGRGGGNTDLGKPVYAASDGIVVHAQAHRVWGNVVLIYHPADQVWTQYAHLDTLLVRASQKVSMAEQIGTIGRGGINPKTGQHYFYAHLHFEVRVVELPADEWPSTLYPNKAQAEAYTQRTRRDTMAFLKSKGAATTLAQARGPQPAPTPPPAPRPQVPPNWKQVRDPASSAPLPGRWVSLMKNEATGEIVPFEVPAYRLKEMNLDA